MVSMPRADTHHCAAVGRIVFLPLTADHQITLMSLFKELKRREVFSSAAYYFAIAWGTIEILEWVLERWQVSPPEWLMPLLATALVVGFPVTMFLAWMFDLDKTGIHRTPPTGKKGRITIFLATLLMIGGTGGLYYLIGTPEISGRVLPPSVRPKVAVLPFEAFSTDPDNIEFADAIHYELLSNLGRISSLLVISRQSVMQYRDSGKSMPAIAAELGVDALLTGAVQRMGKQIRMKIALRDGKHDDQVWSEDFDFEFTPDTYFKVQSEIAETVSEKFQLALAESDRIRVGSAPTRQQTAYGAYLLGRLKLANRNNEDAEAAIELFKEAIHIDPDYALAYVGLAESYDVYRGLGSIPQEEALEIMNSLVDTALSLDGSLGEAYTELGNIRGRQAEFDEAEAAFLRALELSPNYPPLYSKYGAFLYFARQNKEASVQMQKRALELDPRSANINNFLALILEDMGRLREAETYALKALNLSGGQHQGTQFTLGIIYVWGLSDYQRGIHHLEEANRLDIKNPWAASFLAAAWLDLLDEEAAEKWAEIAWERAPYKRASCYAQMGMNIYRRTPEAGIECLQRLLALEPGNPWLLRDFRDFDLSTGRFAEALARYKAGNSELFDSAGPKINGRNYQAAIDLYLVLSPIGEHELADALLEGALEMVADLPRMSSGGYGWADVEIYALQGRTDSALEAMRRAIDEGLRGSWWELPMNLNLQSLWDEPEFKSMLTEIEADMTSKRKAIQAAFGETDVPQRPDS